MDCRSITYIHPLKISTNKSIVKNKKIEGEGWVGGLEWKQKGENCT